MVACLLLGIHGQLHRLSFLFFSFPLHRKKSQRGPLKRPIQLNRHGDIYIYAWIRYMDILLEAKRRNEVLEKKNHTISLVILTSFCTLIASNKTSSLSESNPLPSVLNVEDDEIVVFGPSAKTKSLLLLFLPACFLSVPRSAYPPRTLST